MVPLRMPTVSMNGLVTLSKEMILSRCYTEDGLKLRNHTAILREWGSTKWKLAKGNEELEYRALSRLVRLLCDSYPRAYPLVAKSLHAYGYTPAPVSSIPNTPILSLLKPATGEHYSILSTLHELGHHLFGASELDACRFSVWLFRAAFPNAYDQLEWDGHTLRRPRV